MPTPVGPAPRDPNDPDFWDWDDALSANGGPDDTGLRAGLARRRRRQRVVAAIVVLLMVAAIVAASLH